MVPLQMGVAKLNEKKVGLPVDLFEQFDLIAHLQLEFRIPNESNIKWVDRKCPPAYLN